MANEDFMDQTPSKAVGVFEDHGVQIFIYAKKDEKPSEAIERVAEKHNVAVSQVKQLKK